MTAWILFWGRFGTCPLYIRFSFAIISSETDGAAMKRRFNITGACLPDSPSLLPLATLKISCHQAAEETKIGAAVPSSALVGTWMGIMAVRFLMAGNWCQTNFFTTRDTGTEDEFLRLQRKNRR